MERGSYVLTVDGWELFSGKTHGTGDRKRLGWKLGPRVATKEEHHHTVPMGGCAQENPAQGILDLALDGNGLGSLDWCGPRTTKRSHRIDFLVRWSGVHRLLGSCDRSSADPSRATRYWMRLKRLRVQRVGSIESAL